MNAKGLKESGRFLRGGSKSEALDQAKFSKVGGTEASVAAAEA